ncbi:MAG: hypothetical protein EDX89_16310 [Acidobacteria bacterium]|nr:MAG: hypothetical protein EDX89_16310 [Acidobacteriota bacterium]MCE7956833.1 hypothetical protein [Acidobacteria bacterium ACB2]
MNLRTVGMLVGMATLLLSGGLSCLGAEVPQSDRPPEAETRLYVDEATRTVLAPDSAALPEGFAILGRRSTTAELADAEESARDLPSPLPIVRVPEAEISRLVGPAVSESRPSPSPHWASMSPNSGSSYCRSDLDIYFSEGHRLRVSCPAVGSGMPQYEWTVMAAHTRPAGWNSVVTISARDGSSSWRTLSRMSCDPAPITAVCGTVVGYTRPTDSLAQVSVNSWIRYYCPDQDPLPCTLRASYLVQLPL